MADVEDNPDVDVDFQLEDWLTESGLNKKTEKVLRSEDITDTRTLALLEARDINTLKLPLGQRKLLSVAVAKLKRELGGVMDTPDTADAQPALGANEQTKSPAPPVSGKATAGATAPEAAATTPAEDPAMPDLRASPLLTAGKTYMDLINGHAELDTVIQPRVVSEMDPRSILTVKAQRKKALHITDFLTEATKRRRQSRRKEVVLSHGTDDRVVLQTDDRHPYSGISVGEWGAANCRLMNALLENGELRRDDVEYYLAYTTRIFEYSVKYEWHLVLDYDYQYREMQAQVGFQWGVAAPDMEVRLLAPRQRPSQGRPGPGAANGQRGGATTLSSRGAVNLGQQQQDCRMYLARGYCNFGEKCKFRHPELLHSNPEQDNAKK